MSEGSIERLLAQVAEAAAQATASKMSLTKEDVKAVVGEAVGETLTRLGIQASDPIEMQRDFQHLRNWRKSVEGIQSKGVFTIVGIATTGAVAALWLGLKEFLHKP